MRLRTRIIIAVVIACSIINLFLCYYFTDKIRKSELSSLISRIDKSSKMMQLVNARPLYNVDKETLKVNLETFFADENIRSISLIESDVDIRIVLERPIDPFMGEDIIREFFITFNNVKLGKMNVIYSTYIIERKLSNFRNQMLLFTFSIILILIVALILIINRLLQPVTNLTLAASEIAAGRLDKEIEQNGVGEVGDLSRNFAIMRDSIKDKINDLAKTNIDLENEILQKELNEKKLLKQSAVFKAINTFFQKSMQAKSYKETAEIFLPIAMEIIPCQYCFIGEVNKYDDSILDILAISEQAREDCRMADIEDDVRKRGQLIRGVRAKVITENVSLILNDPASHPDFVELPENHIPLESFMGVPMTLGTEIKGLIAMSGKENGFDTDDQVACEMLCIALVEALSLKKREEEKARLEEMMIQSEKMVSIGGLAAGMAHEINNPLAGILQNSQVISNRLRKKLPANIKVAEELEVSLDKVNKYMEAREIYSMLDSILAAGKRAATIVGNMLSFSRKSSSGFLPEDVTELLDKTYDLAASDYNLKRKYDFKKIKVVKEYENDLPKVKCKASEIQQVFFNILSNGAQAMIELSKQEDPIFKLTVQKEGNWVKVSIKDNGQGIGEKTKKRIFEPFFTTKRVGEGTGLGLAISYFIITENHKGSIEVNSKRKFGTTFIIKLPIT